LRLAIVHRPVFQIQPDAVIAQVRRVPDVERQVVPGAANPGKLSAAQFG
jgi:hypothetical protein